MIISSMDTSKSLKIATSGNLDSTDLAITNYSRIGISLVIYFLITTFGFSAGAF